MQIARAKTIELAIKTAMNALPPKVGTFSCDRPTSRAWHRHQHKVIDMLEARLQEARRLSK